MNRLAIPLSILCSGLFLAACGGSGAEDSRSDSEGAASTSLDSADAQESPAAATPPTATAVTWTKCADEGGTCRVAGTRQVRYGRNGSYAYRTVTGSVACNNTVFGDPLPTIRKVCEAAGTVAQVATRDPLKWPFASRSIWNMPIGSGAVYVPANFPAVPGGSAWAPMPQIDDEIIVLRPTATLTPVYKNTVGWDGGDRCVPMGKALVQVPVPGDYVIPNSKNNNSAAFLAADRRTIVQVQPFTRCAAGGPATSMVKFPDVDLYGNGESGAHGGSGLSTLGGSLRLGELRPGTEQGPRHVLKVNVYAKEMLFRCTVRSDCFRWPATTADRYAVGHYGVASSSTNRAMKMGALLAIPASRPLSSLGLETVPGRQLAWTLQNYGAIIVDDTWGPSFMFNVETGPDGSFRQQFKADWGMELEQRVRDDTPWSRDVQRLMQALHVVDNNTPTSIGGGGVPRQPLAPELPLP